MVSMKVKFILPAIAEAKGPYWRPIKYSLFPPLGLATLAAFLSPQDEAVLCDEHVEIIDTDDKPDLVVIQVYITNAGRAYKIGDHYRQKGCFVIMGGLHVTSLPDEAARHADAVFLGPGEHTFPQFLEEFRNKKPRKRYFSSFRSLHNLPPPRRDLINRRLYLVPNSLVVTRGCPHNCNFCYKHGFFKGGKSFYKQKIDDALAEIHRLPGKHLFFLDDHLFGDPQFAIQLFNQMKGLKRVFQAAATVDSILAGNVIERAAEAGLRSLFVGFESLNTENLIQSGKHQNRVSDYKRAIDRLKDLGVMINGSFVFGLDNDRKDVFKQTVDWGLEMGITTATYHTMTPYPGTRLFAQMIKNNRIITRDWDLYDTRHVVYKPAGMTAEELKAGYEFSYKEFYKWRSIFKAGMQQPQLKNKLIHLLYAVGWKKFEPLWNTIIQLKKLRHMRPVLEWALAKVSHQEDAEPAGLKQKSLRNWR